MISIIGISCFYHDSAAALISDGNIIAAVQEERFSRIKHDPNFPTKSIQFILNYLLIIGIFIMAFIIIRPVLFAIIYGLLFAYILSPLYRFTFKRVKNENLAALIVCLGIFIILAVI